MVAPLARPIVRRRLEGIHIGHAWPQIRTTQQSVVTRLAYVERATSRSLGIWLPCHRKVVSFRTVMSSFKELVRKEIHDE
jgi:hypothetical protein